jgi:predicted adenine nucleotide alpha hydrolase (AANH) superfamily ATPase
MRRYIMADRSLLLQTCCGPCLTGSRIPFENEEDLKITALWYNPNIHPFSEYDRRLQTLQRYVYLEPIEVQYIDSYDLYPFICGVIGSVWKEDRIPEAAMTTGERRARCSFCYATRLRRTAEEAKEKGFSQFSTTMLLSRHQDHEAIRRIGGEIGDEVGVDFLYKDLRKHWRDSIRISKGHRMYRQPYCGCIFSEQERYAGQDGSSDVSR